MAEEIERVNYYQLQYLGAEDFQAEQAYHRDMRRRHNVGHHLWGIVTGLEIVEIAKGSGAGYDVYVQPGFAIDGFGREIIVTAPYKLDPVDFRALDSGTHEVWIGYREQLDTPPAAGFEPCGDDGQNNRVHEEFRIYPAPKPPTHPPIVVGGKTAVRKSDPAAPTAPVVIPDDESVPYQDFPEDRERWLIRLGNATWDENTQLFAETPVALRGVGRSYTGAVAENLLSPAAKLFLRPRDFTTGKEDDADFAQVQGRLQVDGRLVARKEIHLHGERFRLQTTKGADGNVPVWLQRREPDGPVGVDLRVNIGPKTAPPPGEKPHRLSVGIDSDDPAKAKTVLAVRSDDNVEIITGKLNFGIDPLRQIVNFRGEDFGVGVQKTDLLYQRTASGYAWYRGGRHVDTERDPGPGGTLVMELTSTNKLQVHGPIEATAITAPVVTANDVRVKGGKVHLLDAAGSEDTDEISLARLHHSGDRNDLRVIIGDNSDGLDSFTVGINPGNVYDTKFQVKNNGEVSMTGDLTLPAGRFIHIGSMKLGGTYPVDVVVARYFINAVNASDVYPPFPQPPIQIVSRMPVVTSAEVHVALSYISNAGSANNASWGVFPVSKSVSGNVVSFRIQYQVTDSDGYLGWATAIIVMVP